MIPHILGSKPVVEAMEADLKPRVELLRQQGIVPKLAIVRVGANPDDLSYERMAIKRAESLDIAVQVFDYPENVDPELVAGDIRYINEDASIHGCLMFRPLPEYMDEQALCNILVPHKDVDGISVAALGGIFIDDPDALPPATAEACIKVLDHYAIPLQGKRVVVVGRSLVIGKPVSMILLRHNASVTICHSKTLDLAEVTRQADIVICATGRARAFGAEYFTEGQIVLDVGINFDAEGHMCGDVDFEAVEPIVAAITPVPGGIGSVTTSCTMEHTVRSAERSARKGVRVELTDRKITSLNVEETQRIAAALAEVVVPGTVIALEGDLGAGKTHFTQGLARGLGVGEAVTSPTFNVMSVYDQGRLPLYHFDLYRLEDALELEDIAFYDYVEADGVSCIEWAAKFPEEIPTQALWISITTREDNARSIEAHTTSEETQVLIDVWFARIQAAKHLE